jgi:hypothetical protein
LPEPPTQSQPISDTRFGVQQHGPPVGRTRSSGEIDCNYAPAIEANSGNFGGTSGTTTVGTANAPSATSLAQVTLNGRSSPASTYLFMATVNTTNYT